MTSIPEFKCQHGSQLGQCAECAKALESVFEAEQDMPSELEFRRRGRPRLDPDKKRREKVTIALTESEARLLRTIAAQNGHKRLQDWVRAVVLAAAGETTPE